VNGHKYRGENSKKGHASYQQTIFFLNYINLINFLFEPNASTFHD